MDFGYSFVTTFNSERVKLVSFFHFWRWKTDEKIEVLNCNEVFSRALLGEISQLVYDRGTFLDTVEAPQQITGLQG